jgi:hypothetical protein
MSVGPRGYITYFDQRYLPRALVMLRSLRRHDPEARVFPLCFDALAFDVVSSLADPMIAPIEAAALIAFEPRLPDCAERGRWAFYATHKPLLPLYVFAQHPELAALAHIDADTWFFAAPAPLYAELGDASVGLSPHRLSPPYEHYEVYGKFNAGFIYWRHDETALRCLEDYRADCLSWCYNRVEPDGRYMNQGYLTTWPDRYPNVHVLQHPGANLAFWNIARHHLAEKPSLTADGEPVVFYHFSNLYQDRNRVWRTQYAGLGPQHRLVLRALYHPYLSEIEKTDRQLRCRWPGMLPIDPQQQPWLETMPALRAYSRLSEKIVSALRRPGRVKRFLRFYKSVLHRTYGG